MSQGSVDTRDDADMFDRQSVLIGTCPTERQYHGVLAFSRELEPTSISSSGPGLFGLCRRRARPPRGSGPRRTDRQRCWSVPLEFRCEPRGEGARSAAASPDKTSRLSAAPAVQRWSRLYALLAEAGLTVNDIYTFTLKHVKLFH